MNNKRHLFALAFLFIFLASTIAYSGTTGKIAGVVKDKQSGMPLAGANVIIEGTTMGAAADENGYFFIINIPPGKYRVRASMMGYHSVVQTEVQVVVDLTTKLNFDLPSTILTGEAVEIIAQRPILEKDVTATQMVTTAEQIDQMPVNTFQEILMTSPGIVESVTFYSSGESEAGFNARGGRTNEMSYMIDGFYVEEPLFGGMGSNVANTGIAELAVMTGTFNAEYGEALSGVLNIVTKEGGDNYSGKLRFRTDKFVNPHKNEYYYKHLNADGEWVKLDENGDVIGLVSEVGTQPVTPGSNKNSEQYWVRESEKVKDFNTYRPDFYFGGPIPFLPRGYTFFVAGDMLDTDTYLGWTDQTYRKERRINGKLILKPHKSMKLTFGGVYNRERWKTYNHQFKYLPEIRPTNYNDNYMLTRFAANVMPGVYLYHITSHVEGHEDEVATGKFAIIK